MLTLNKPFWSKDQNDLFKAIIWNDFFRNEFGRNLDMVPNHHLTKDFQIENGQHLVNNTGVKCMQNISFPQGSTVNKWLSNSIPLIKKING